MNLPGIFRETKKNQPVMGVEPTISCLEGRRIIHFATRATTATGDRTQDRRLIRPVLYQLSYCSNIM